MARLIRPLLGWLVVLVLAAAGYLVVSDHLRRNPQDVPWTELRLTDPQGLFTLAKLTALESEPDRCRALLSAAGVEDRAVPERRSSPDCGFSDGVLLSRELRFAPRGLVTSCPVAAALFLLDRDVLQLAAQRHFAADVVSVRHAGSYHCRRLYNRPDGPFSEHATADAVDVLGFTLSDGTDVSVLRDWNGGGPKAAFLREVRDGAFGMFATVLSPDYNQAHADHFHLDMAARGRSGFSVCR